MLKTSCAFLLAPLASWFLGSIQPAAMMIMVPADVVWGTCPSSLSESKVGGVPVETVAKWMKADGTMTTVPAFIFTVLDSDHSSGDCGANGETTKDCNYWIKLQVKLNLNGKPMGGTIGNSGQGTLYLQWDDGANWMNGTEKRRNLNEGFSVPTGLWNHTRIYEIAFQAACETVATYKVKAMAQGSPPSEVGSKDFVYTCGSCVVNPF